ncbi:hypothetical protein BHE74_00010367 [Ensete ventricosum]|nr:hypothetical protein BHE74_00010367 [Ensete ventricosum]RZR76458.1 hypothetical protein BHM03_00001240 [Ensete ventricosum]
MTPLGCSCERLILNCVMRLNRVELFYAFVTVIHSKGSEDRVAYRGGCSQPGPCKSDHLWPGCLQGWPATTRAASKGDCKGRSTEGSGARLLIGATALALEDSLLWAKVIDDGV